MGHTTPRGPWARPRLRDPPSPASGAVPPAVWTLVKTDPKNYLQAMLKAYEFCIPIAGTKVPAGPEWLHEIKYDGYRLRVERNGDRYG